MIRHLLRLVWNRRRANALMALEVFLSFLVLVAVATTALHLWNNYRQPLGFDYRDTWSIRVLTMDAGGPGDTGAPDRTPVAMRARVQTLVGLVRDLPGAVAATAVGDAPYSHSGWTSSIETGGRDHQTWSNRADDSFAATVGLVITRGRWFNASDEGDPYEPVVVNERLARELFGRDDPVGRIIKPDKPAEANRPPRPTLRVVGVILDYRKDGEFSAPDNWVFYRLHRERAVTFGPGVPRYIVVRAQPGATSAFESQVVKRLSQAAPGWSFKARPLALARSGFLREDVPNLAAGGLVAAFLLAMVVLGLTGVLWLMVTQRTREIGLRRAKGATAGAIRRQVVGEVMVLTAIGVAGGLVVTAQMPLLDIFPSVPWPVYAAGVVVAAVAVLGLAGLCAWVPSRLAASVVPAEALRYE